MKNILIIDDNMYLLQAMVEFLQMENYGVLAARDGVEGMQLLTQMQDVIDLIMLDLKMPFMDGYEFLQKKEEMGFKHKVMILTGSRDQDMVENIPEDKIWKIMFKPFSFWKLLQVLNELDDC